MADEAICHVKIAAHVGLRPLAHMGQQAKTPRDPRRPARHEEGQQGSPGLAHVRAAPPDVGLAHVAHVKLLQSPEALSHSALNANKLWDTGMKRFGKSDTL